MSADEGTGLKAKVGQWLETQGYPLEMQVARAFLKEGFAIRQSEYYEDPETKVARETDVIAHAQALLSGCLIRITVCAECKASKEKPWVLLTSPQCGLAGPAQVVQRAASRLGTKFLASVAHDKRYQALELLRLPDRPGFGVTQAFTSGNDVAYAACISASKAASGLAAKADIASERQGPVAEILLPVVIIEGRLFECFLDEHGSVIVNEVAEGTLVWRNQLVHMPHTIIRIVTLASLTKFVQEFSAAASLFLASDDEIKRLMSAANVTKTWRIPEGKNRSLADDQK